MKMPNRNANTKKKMAIMDEEAIKVCHSLLSQHGTHSTKGLTEPVNNKMASLSPYSTYEKVRMEIPDERCAKEGDVYFWGLRSHTKPRKEPPDEEEAPEDTGNTCKGRLQFLVDERNCTRKHKNIN